MKDLHDLFQNWTLAIAAYNCGERRIQAEIGKQKVNSYYFLKLPQETERYVFRILAIKEVLRNPEKYGYHLPKGAGYQPIIFERVNVNLPGPMPIIGSGRVRRGDLPRTEGAQSLPGFGRDPEGGPYDTSSRGQGKASSRKG